MIPLATHVFKTGERKAENLSLMFPKLNEDRTNLPTQLFIFRMLDWTKQKLENGFFR